MKDADRRGRFVVGIETSGPTGSVALLAPDGWCDERGFRGHLTHARELIAVLDAITKERGTRRDEITLVCVDQGPGSYTGIRVGVTAAKSLAWALGIASAGVMGLDVIAGGAPRSSGRLRVIVDARRGTLYHASYWAENGRWRRESGPEVLSPKEVLACLSADDIVVGDGIALLPDTLPVGVTVLKDEVGVPRASQVARLGLAKMEAAQILDPAELLPIYLRRPEAVEKWEARRKEMRETRASG